jgi:hypothetical protein
LVKGRRSTDKIERLLWDFGHTLTQQYPNLPSWVRLKVIDSITTDWSLTANIITFAGLKQTARHKPGGKLKHGTFV